MNIAELKTLLAAKTSYEPKPSGNGFVCRCPAHEDNSPSLSVSEGRKGILLKCHAGCTLDAITAALGVKPAELFNGNGRNGKGGSPHKPRLNIEAVYDYHDTEGKLLFQVCRLEPKDFRQRRPDPNRPGKFIWNLKGVKSVPYRLPELITSLKAGEPVFIAEGEKDVASLVSHKFTATCNAGGAGKRQDGFAKWFDGAKAVVVIADKDAPGRKHAAVVATNLKSKVQSVKVIELPDVAGRTVKDAHDFFEAGGTADQLRERAEAAPEFEPPAAQSKTDNATDTPAERVTSAGLICIADETKIAAVPLYYYAERQQWFYANGRGGFFKISDSQAKVILAEYGFNRSIKDPQGNTAADRAHSWKMQRDAVAYAGELAGYPAGCHEINGTKILATNSPRMITPKAGEFPKIQQLVETLLADDEHPQAEIFRLWLSKSYIAYVERFNYPSGAQFRHAPALYIAGPRESGKTALIDLVLTPLFGGRKADPMNYLREPKFNKDLFAASLLALDDKGAGSSLAERRERGERISVLALSMPRGYRRRAWQRCFSPADASWTRPIGSTPKLTF